MSSKKSFRNVIDNNKTSIYSTSATIKQGLDGPKACRLTWHSWSNSRSWIIFKRCDSVHGELFRTEPNKVSQIKLLVF